MARPAETKRQHGTRDSTSGRRNVDARANSHDDSGRGRRLLFLAGDFVFLVCAGIAATVAMHIVHELGWPFVPTCLLGMVVAMVLQTLLAVMAAPILGSIETMVPSMIVAMASPMAICTLHLVGQEPTRFMAIAIGIVVASGMFVFVQLYGRACDNVLREEGADVPN